MHAKKRDDPGSFYMEIEIEIWMCRDERHVSAFRQVTLVAQASLPYSQLR
jgi:hypothetical protein